jgi:hypothetical protein
MEAWKHECKISGRKSKRVNIRIRNVYRRTFSKVRIIYTRGGQLDYLREPHFRRQQSAGAMCSTLKFIKSKYRSVLTDEHLTKRVRTALTAYQPNFKNLTAYPELFNQITFFVLKIRILLTI